MSEPLSDLANMQVLVTPTRTSSGHNRCVCVVALVHVTLEVNVDVADLSVVEFKVYERRKSTHYLV